jgi:hypothetical protein
MCVSAFTTTKKLRLLAVLWFKEAFPKNRVSGSSFCGDCAAVRRKQNNAKYNKNNCQIKFHVP